MYSTKWLNSCWSVGCKSRSPIQYSIWMVEFICLCSRDKTRPEGSCNTVLQWSHMFQTVMHSFVIRACTQRLGLLWASVEVVYSCHRVETLPIQNAFQPDNSWASNRSLRWGGMWTLGDMGTSSLHDRRYCSVANAACGLMLRRISYMAFFMLISQMFVALSSGHFKAWKKFSLDPHLGHSLLTL